MNRMKTEIKNGCIRKLFCAVCVISVVMQCSQITVSDSGGGDISVVDSKICGIIRNSGGEPAQGATVYLRPVDYLPDAAALAKKKAEGSAVCTTLTNGKGKFSFFRTSVIEGVHCIEAVSSDKKLRLFIDSIVIDQAFLESDTWIRIDTPRYDTRLKPPCTIEGSGVVADTNISGTVQVLGLDVYTTIESDGSFILDNLPEGTLRLKITTNQSGEVKDDTLTVSTIADETVYTVVDSGNEVITDIDGNEYHTIQIGNQTWMVENLMVTKYNDGTSIPLVTGIYEWFSLSTPGYCWYNNEISNKIPYGALYNWYVVDPDNPHKVAPEGWHIPSRDEWGELTEYLIANGYNYDGTTEENKISKSLASTTEWNTSLNEGVIGNDLSANNSSGFSAFPGGMRNVSGAFGFIDEGTRWWTVTEAKESPGYYYSYGLYYGSPDLSSSPIHVKFGHPIRCLKD